MAASSTVKPWTYRMTTQPAPDPCTRVHVTPAPGRAVRMPERGHALMPAQGCEVPRNVYWARRIAVCDVYVTPPVTPPATPKGKKPHERQL